MDNVSLLNKHKKDIKIISKIEGRWEKGKYVNESTIEKAIKGVYMPVSMDTLKYYPQGSITLEDKELFTKELLKNEDIVLINNQEFKVVESTDFDYLADIKIYLLRRSTKDD